VAAGLPPGLAAIAVRAAASAQVFVGDPVHPVLAPDDAHHLGRVLRLRDGEEVIVSDGAGHWARTRWTAGGPGSGALAALDDGSGPGGDGLVQFEPAPAPALTVAFAPTKGERPEWVVQKLTELGIDRIVPLVSERSVVRWSGARAEGAVDRLRRVAREAAGQCRRVWLPHISPVVRFDALGGLGAPAGAQGGLPGDVVLAQLSGDRLSTSHRVVAIGPEGGWSADELGSGLPTVGFGLSVLRAETAAVTAAALMVSLRTGTVAQMAPTTPQEEPS
jgi:16S rRNA (uracil1498-N3)-methyltransferase